MPNIDIQIKDNRLQLENELDIAIANGLEACGMVAESHASEYETAVDTGRLRSSITHTAYPQVKEKAMFIGTNVEYAPYIEFGVRGRQGLHYLKRAIGDNISEYEDILKSSLNTL